MGVTLIPSERNARKTRVAAYVRVSTMQSTQEESYEAQAKYYEEFIRANPEWDFAGIYGERLSGTHAENREEFNRLIRDALDKKIDLIYCKSVSRWARNTVEALEKIKLLTGNQVNLVFEQENIDTRRAGVTLQLSLAASIAQSESESISENMKWTYRNRAMMGIYKPGKGRHFGYNTEDGKFEPDGNAKYVELMFQMFAEGKTVTDIAQELNRLGVKNSKGNDWNAANVKGILGNEVYVGDCHFGKRPSRNIITGEPDEIQYERYMENHHKGIVDRGLWNQAQARLHERTKKREADEASRLRTLRILRNHPDMTCAGLAKALDVDKAEAKRFLYAIRARGWVHKEGKNWIVDEEAVGAAEEDGQELPVCEGQKLRLIKTAGMPEK